MPKYQINADNKILEIGKNFAVGLLKCYNFVIFAMNIHTIYRIFQDRYRPARMKKFTDLLNVTDNHKIIDLGGSETNWTYIKERPTVLAANIAYDEEILDNVEIKRMDATTLPLEDNCMDIAFSNSVIEHVGDWEAQKAFAREARRVAPSYYVQTPNRWFFIEPHFLCPLVHFLPRPLYRKLLPFFSIWYWITRPTREKMDDVFEEIQMLSKVQMEELFPDGEIIEEKFLWIFTKSFTAFRRG